jgi:hypothetical protein
MLAWLNALGLSGRALIAGLNENPENGTGGGKWPGAERRGRPRPPSLSICNNCKNGSYLCTFPMKRQSLKLDEIDWQALMGIACQMGCEYRDEPSRRRLIDQIASGKLTVVDKPDKLIRSFQEKMRQLLREQQEKKLTASFMAEAERNPLRHERKRRTAGIAPRGAQEELEKATGYRDEFGRLTKLE